jgi:hypothetical protein
MSKSRKSPRSNKGERPKYYTNYSKDKSGAPRKMLGVGGQKVSGIGGSVKKRVIDLSSNKSSADISNKRGIMSKKVRGVAMSKKGAASVLVRQQGWGKTRWGKNSANLRDT